MSFQYHHLMRYENFYSGCNPSKVKSIASNVNKNSSLYSAQSAQQKGN